MSFLYPLGLLGLLGIPVLIIIYILKNKYTEQTVASTYLWTLSNKFLKRKNPISKLTGIISLILQILAVACLSLAIAHPSLIIPNKANEYCFILDASGSMNMQSDGQTRFERGKQTIAEMIESSVNGSVYTLVYVADGTNVLYERISDKEKALAVLEETEVSCDTAEFTDSIGIAQGFFDDNKGLKTYLVTDTQFKKVKNINVVNVAKGENNCAVESVTYALEAGTLTVNGNLFAYEKDDTLTVNVYTDGAEEAKASTTVEAVKNQSTPFTLTCECSGFSSLKVTIADEDGLAQDNEYVIYNTTSESAYDTLIVSDTPFFLKTAVKSLINAKIDVVSPKDYLPTTGYGLYIFDSFNPQAMPTDGAVWLFNPQAGIKDAGFNVQGELILEASEKLEISTSSSTTVQKLTQDLAQNEIYVSKYMRCGLYQNFTTLYSHQGNPVVFAGTNTYGNRETVFAFSLHDSNLPVLYDYVVLLRNLIRYSFPDIVDKTDYACGETVDINVVANCESVRVESPSGSVSYLDINGATVPLALQEVGTYTVTLNIGAVQRTVYVYSAMTEAERAPKVTVEEEIRLQGMPSKTGLDGKYDLFTVLIIALAVIFIADWGVYCYEKHQLR